MDGRDRPCWLPKDLVRAVAEGADLDAEVGYEEDEEGSPAVVFRYAGREVGIPSSLLHQSSPSGVPGALSPAPARVPLRSHAT